MIPPLGGGRLRGLWRASTRGRPGEWALTAAAGVPGTGRQDASAGARGWGAPGSLGKRPVMSDSNRFSCPSRVLNL